MNKFIADMFSDLLRLAHVIVALIIGYFIYRAFFDSDNTSHLFLLYALGAAISYILVVGLVSTVVAIYEQLKILNQSVEGIKDSFIEVGSELSSIDSTMNMIESTISSVDSTISNMDFNLDNVEKTLSDIKIELEYKNKE